MSEVASLISRQVVGSAYSVNNQLLGTSQANLPVSVQIFSNGVFMCNI